MTSHIPRWRMLARWRRRRRCFHHDLPGHWTEPQTYIHSELIDLGRRKRFWCEENLGGCDKVWIV